MSYTLRNDALGGGGGSSQWSGTAGYPIYYVQNVGIGAVSAPTASLMVTGNIYASNTITTPNVTISGLTNISNLQISGVSGTSGQVPTATGVGSGIVWTTPSGGGGSSQWTGTVGNPIYYIPFVGIGSSLNPTASLMVTGNIYASNAIQTSNIFSTLANIATLNVTGVSNLVTLNTATLYVRGVSNLVSLNVTGVSNLVSLNVTGVSNLVTLNTATLYVTGVSNLVTLNVSAGYISNIYTSNIQGFTGSQWTGTISAPIYYVPQVGIGSTVTPTANLMVTGNIYASNSLTTPNVTVSGLTNISNLQISGVSGTAGQIVTATGTGSGIQWSAGGGSSQWGGTSGFPIYYGPVVGIGVTGATASTGSNLYVQGNVYVSNAVTSYGSYSILNTAILGKYVGGGDISSSTYRPINIYTASYPNFLTLGGSGFYFNEVPLTTLTSKNLTAYGTATAMSADGHTILVTSNNGDAIVYRFTRGAWDSGTTLPIKESTFGWSCAMSADGNTIVITCNFTGTGVYVFRYNLSSGWDSSTKLSPKSITAYGQACDISADGNTIIVTGIDSTAMTPIVYRCTAGIWDSGTALTPKSVSNFGQSCAMSADGNTVVVTGCNNGTTPCVYRYTNGAWDTGTLLAGQAGVLFGWSCAMSADGNVILVTCVYTGQNPYIYRYTSSGWTVTALTAKSVQNYGQSCAMSADGNTVLVTGMNAGVTPFIYKYTGTWDTGTALAGQLPAFFGQSSAMSSDGNTLVINSKLDTGMTPYVYLLGPRFKVNNTLNVYNYGVGIGSALPGSNLTVIGNIYASNTITTPNVTVTGLTNLYNLQISGVSGTTGQVLAATGTGSAIQWTAGTQWTGAVGTPIYYVPLVGIGSTVTPTANLMVTGNIYASNTITTPNVTVTGLTNMYNLQISGVSGTTGQVLAATGTGSAIQWTAGTQWTGAVGTPIYYVPRVGIGSTVTPTANLMVTGNVYCSSTQGTSTPDLGTAFFINPTNSANQDISCGISLAGSSARNCYYSYNVTGVNGYSHGISGTSQNLVFKASSDFSSSVIFTMDRLGNFTAAQDISAYSDRRLKKDFKKIEGALDKLSKINGYTFIRTDEVAKNQKQAGVIAQEVLEVLPEVVKINEETGYYTVAYGNLTALLIEALKEERQKREELEQRLTRIILDKL
jgi:hypothetical protein